MFRAQQWVHTILILFLHHPIFIRAVSYAVDNNVNLFEDSKKVSSTKDTRAFGCDMSTLVIFVFIILNIIVYKLCELHETECSEKDEAFVIPSGERFHRFSLAEILLATNSFDEKCLIGKGGSARVYKGMIDNGGTPVAIKRLSFVNKRCGGSMFWTEIQMLSKLRHSHLVSLVGYCDEQNEMILVFEYIPCGTLSDHLHRSFEKGYYTLSWIERLRICIGAARGLDYLHTGTSIHQRVIHRDVKTTNILLDDHLEAKIADFGISKIVTANQGCTYVSTAVKGTFGYMDPSYFVTGRLTRKSDVYAFGVVLFEVLSGRRAVDLSRDDKQYKQFGLAGWAQTCIRQGRIIEIVDSTLKSEISKESLLAFVRIAYRCLNGQPDCRPTMAEIVVVLEFALALQENPEFTRFEGKSGSNSPPHLAAVEVAYGEDQVKSFEMNRSRITFSGKFCRTLLASIRALSVHTNAKRLSYNRKENRVDNKLSLNKLGVFPEANNRARLNKVDIFPQAKGLAMTADSRRFSLAELSSTTRGFSPDLMLSEGNYGSVFIGWLDEDTFAPSRIGIGKAVVIVRCSPDQRLRTTQMEVDLYGRYNHPNLANRLGFCLEGQELLLIYGYIPNGSVERYAYKDNGKSLSWVVWLKILIGTARYLDFLHSSEDHIIFGELTPSSILLDEEFNPKICIRGSSRLGPSDGDTLVTGIPCVNAHYSAESEGYLSPEYKEAGQLSSKNDVYAFGVVLLEILTGMRVVDANTRNKKKNLVNKARPILACERKFKRVVNPKLLEQKYCPEGLNSILSDVPALALQCLDLDPEKRPSMKQVVEILERINGIVQ
ncbi:uncharacterized protein LOC108198895 isoform X1 [Daucus carota subsp. sativus]|uniref:uncharacterized protein LOC108198895 isoform X1 n=1 Tax=Daucus carota subsp. sativus TaxID=79200 RepID=UPI0007EF138D|nr:PREDICTED: uncharacterized protein LOC108198895 [Daucus carota subsp. sativus]